MAPDKTGTVPVFPPTTLYGHLTGCVCAIRPPDKGYCQVLGARTERYGMGNNRRTLAVRINRLSRAWGANARSGRMAALFGRRPIRTKSTTRPQGRTPHRGDCGRPRRIPPLDKIKEEGFVPRPTFWDDEQAPARGGVPTADNENLTRLGAWAQDQINAGNIPGETMGFSWKEAERRAKAAFPTLRGTSGRQLRRLFDKLLGRTSA